VFIENPEAFDPRAYLTPARDAMKEVCKARMIAFGQAGWAGKVPTKSCTEMVDFYK
jgi:fructose-bisphosphate aldolase class II